MRRLFVGKTSNSDIKGTTHQQKVRTYGEMPPQKKVAARTGATTMKHTKSVFNGGEGKVKGNTGTKTAHQPTTTTTTSRGAKYTSSATTSSVEKLRPEEQVPSCETWSPRCVDLYYIQLPVRRCEPLRWEVSSKLIVVIVHLQSL